MLTAPQPCRSSTTRGDWLQWPSSSPGAGRCAMPEDRLPLEEPEDPIHLARRMSEAAARMLRRALKELEADESDLEEEAGMGKPPWNEPGEDGPDE